MSPARLVPLFAWLDIVASRVRGLRGPRRLLFAACTGAVAALAFPPFLLWPFLLLGYAAFVLQLDGAAESRHRVRSSAAIGWAFGFGHFLIGLHWIGYAFLVDPTDHAWELPFVAILLPGGLGIFFAISGALCGWLWTASRPRIFLFAAIVGGVEYARGHVLTGFPWNLPGYGWGASLGVLQSAAVFGVYGLSFLTVLFGASLALLASGEKQRRAVLWPAVLAGAFVLIWANGEARLAFATNAAVPGVRLRIVQPDTPQTEKYVDPYIVRNWRRLVYLSLLPAKQPITHILWPEAAPPFLLQREPAAMKDVAAIVAGGRTLLTGAVRYEGQPSDKRFYNSFFVFDSHANLVATYDKFHLVPFGEYLPFENVLHALGISQIAGGDTGFLSGPGPRTLMVPGAPPMGPLICYEIIFPGRVTSAMRPQWFANVTDDSWFGPAAGPAQHFLIARVRAIEEGIPVARSANSGISAMIDSFGRVWGRLNLNTRGVLDTNLPVAIAPTPYVLFGDAVPATLFLVLLAFGLAPRLRDFT
jgi:apolipoprotein N-acyltransferase